MSLPLTYAQRCAAKLVTWLTPFTERIEVAGSIRRCRPFVGDIDLVAIPRVQEHRDLLGTLERMDNLTAIEIRRRCATTDGWGIKKDGDQFLSFVAPRWTASGDLHIQVDLWFATPETFGTVLLCRTGSKEHNIKLAQRAQQLGGHWSTHEGVTIGLRRFPATTEQDVFDALQMDFVPPTQRD